jgi:hypothetical protein
VTTRRRVEPLPPPPGSFDEVMRRAHYRRHRRAAGALTLAVVFVAGVAGGVAIDAPRHIVEAANHAANQLAPPAESESPDPDAGGKDGKDGKGKKGKKDKGKSSIAGGSGDGRQSISYLRGVAVGPAGQPAGGLYVYVGVRGSDTFVPTRNAAAVTAADGSFTLPCPRTPVLLAPWPIFGQAKSKARAASWQATFVGGATNALTASVAPCGEKVVRTVVLAGSTVTGNVSMPVPCDDQHNDLLVWLHGDRRSHVRIQDLTDGAVYRVGGLPPGQHTLVTNDVHTLVTVGGGAVSEADVVLVCDGPSTTPEPTDTSKPSPSPTASKTPTGAASPSPSPSTASASPSESPEG